MSALLSRDPSVANGNYLSIEKEGNHLAEKILQSTGPNGLFLDVLGRSIRDAYIYTLDKEENFDDLERCEKAIFGVKVEKYTTKSMGWPRQTKQSKKSKNRLLLDTLLFDTAIDFKCTIHNNWMIPPKCKNQWCLLIRLDRKSWTFEVGVFFAVEHHLTNGHNWDRKLNLNAIGKTHIIWLARDVALPPL